MTPTRKRAAVVFLVITVLVLITTIAVLLIFWLRCHSDSGSRSESISPPELKKNWSKAIQLQDIVDRLNKESLAWKATVNPSVDPKLFISSPTPTQPRHMDESVTSVYWKTLGRSKELWADYKLWSDSVAHMRSLNKSEQLPKQCDSRVKWPLCHSIRAIRNQGKCGSCWAESMTAAISDRICIASNQTRDVRLSSIDLMECCDDCGGCEGSTEMLLAWDHYVNFGIVTGGSHNSYEGCKPYEYAADCGYPCTLDDHWYTVSSAPKLCRRRCSSIYNKQYEDDKFFGEKTLILPSLAYSLSQNLLNNITLANLARPMMHLTADEVEFLLKSELFYHGPFTLSFPVTADFFLYSSGVYHPSRNPGKFVYLHSLKLIGWGEKELPVPTDFVRDIPYGYSGQLIIKNVTKIPYWIAANSWGRNWGEDGFFRIIRSPQLMPEMYEDVLTAIPARTHAHPSARQSEN